MSGGWYAIMYSVVLKSRQNTFTSLLPRVGTGEGLEFAQ